MKKSMLYMVLILIVTVLLLAACGNKEESSGAAPTGETKQFTVNAKNFEFDVKEMRVKRGDTVEVTLINAEGNHALKFDGYNKEVQANQTISFVADKTGEFQYVCSIFCGTDHDKMVGKLIVE